MRALLDIARKEARIYLTTWTSWVVTAAFFELTAFFFVLLVREYQERRVQWGGSADFLPSLSLDELVLAPMLSYAATFFLFLLPVLTMRLIAEERRDGTLELLLTAPVPAWAVVLGKYLAAWSMMALMLGLTLALPAALGGWAGADAFDWSTLGVGYLGMLLLGTAGVALGLFASSLTDSQVVAVTVGFALLLLLVVLGVAAQGQSEPWRSVLEQLSISHHQQAFARGLVRSQDVVYYLSLTFLGLFFANRLVAAERWR